MLLIIHQQSCTFQTKDSFLRENFDLLENCGSLPPKEVILTSLVSAIQKFDMSNCKILEENVVVSPIVLFFRKNHFLIEAVNEKLGLFKSAGLIDFWIANSELKK